MSYTREQAEEVLNDLWRFNGFFKGLSDDQKAFLNHKFPQKVSGWYKDKRYPKLIIYFSFEKDLTFGFDFRGEWVKLNSTTEYRSTDTQATDEEVLQRLTEEANRRYPEGSKVKSLSSGEIWTMDEPKGRFHRNYFLFDSIAILNLTTGEWAEVVEKDEKKEKIEKLIDKLNKLLS